MRSSVHEPASVQVKKSTDTTKSGPSYPGQSPAVRSALHLQRTIGNRAGQRLLHAKAEDSEKKKSHDESERDEKDACRESVLADERYRQIPLRIGVGSHGGEPLAPDVNREMGLRMGADFSNVRIHTDIAASFLNKGLNARAFTHGSDIYFNEGEYKPDSSGGKLLLAHELAHVVQQSRTTDKGARRGMIQRTTIGQVLDNFFSPFSRETLWVMPESDNYTRIVRTWQPVINAVNQAKANLAADCATWQASHMTDRSWTPGMTDPPVTDPNAHGIWVASPPGTDPATCRDAFIIYVASRANPSTPTRQTFELYTCSIGSFGIYVTVDSIDCNARTARMNVWMYNSMDRDSFGRFANHPLFALSGMERQYMWWNWHESHSWGSATIRRTPPADESRTRSVLWFRHNSTELRQDREIDSTVHMAIAQRRIRQHLLAVGDEARIVVHGYASSEGDPAHNMNLSRRRAERIRRDLVAAGIPGDKISIVAHGRDSTHPSLADNRRVEIEHTRAGAGGGTP